MSPDAPTPRQLCDACGYEVTGVAADACPECGAAPLKLAPDPASVWKPWWVALLVCVAHVLGFSGLWLWVAVAGQDPFAYLAYPVAALPPVGLVFCLAPAATALFERNAVRRDWLARSRRWLWGYVVLIDLVVGWMLLVAAVGSR